MQRTFLYAKLHQARVTQADLYYEGSFSIDEELLIASGILPNEQISIFNIDNGERFTTYAITAPYGSRTIGANGACAHRVNIGDQVIICAYAQLCEHEIAQFTPKILLLDEQNNYRVKDEANPHFSTVTEISHRD